MNTHHKSAITLEALADERRWVAWRSDDGRKVPYDPRNRTAEGSRAASNNPKTWGTRQQAWDAALTLRDGRGSGLMLGQLEDDGPCIAGVDLDSCRDSLTGDVEPWAKEVVEGLASYTEVSPSESGLKVFFTIAPDDLAAVRAALGGKQGQAWKFGAGKHPPAIELYTGRRWFAVTALHHPGTPPDLRPAPLERLMGIIGKTWPAGVPSAPVAGSMGQGSKAPRDTSRSGRALALAGRTARAGGTLTGFREALEADAELAGWSAEKGEREVLKTWTKAEADAQAGADSAGATERAVARRVEARHGDEIRFCNTSKRWLVWDGHIWRPDTRAKVQGMIGDACTALRAIGDGPVAGLEKYHTVSGATNWLKIAPALVTAAEDWDAHKMLLGTPGGTVDLFTGMLRDGLQSDLLTKATAVTPIPSSDFDEALDCPHWLRFLNDATAGDAGLIRFLQQWGGYCLTGDTTEHALLFIYGPGGNGKSVFLNTLAGIMGDYAANTTADALATSKFARHTTDIAMLQGTRLASSSETQEGRAWDETLVKSLTGGDPITARFMRQDNFQFTPQFKLTVVGNHKPVLNNVDAAIRRRFNIVPFTHAPARPDPDLESKLRGEWPGILAWLVEGCVDWRKNRLLRPQVVLDATNEYFEAQDIFGQWLEECCEVGRGYSAAGPALAESWEQFARSRGECPQAGDRSRFSRTFSDALASRGFARIKDTMGIRGRGFDGIRLRPTEAEGDGDDL